MGYYTEDEMFMVNNNMSRVVKKNIWQDLSQYSLSLQNKIVTFVKDIIICLAKPCLDT